LKFIQPDCRFETAVERTAIDVFGGGATAAAPLLDLKELHATIGRLTLESDFSEGALHKAELLSQSDDG
jgi:hypothetical protein